MSWKQTEVEFEQFAEPYAWMFGQARSQSALTLQCRKAIEGSRPSRILDCACGPGWQAVTLKNEGYVVTGTDISRQMIRLAKANAREKGQRIPFKVAAWHELPKTFSPSSFDFIMCHGNAIGHCKGEKTMVQSLKAMRAVIKEGGFLYLDTRSWEWLRSKAPKYWTGPIRDDEKGHHVVLTRADIPRKWSEPHTFEMVHVVEGKNGPRIEHYPITFYAFKKREFLKRLRRSGFTPIETESIAEGMGYTVVAQAV